jgi:hypothetical protein
MQADSHSRGGAHSRISTLRKAVGAVAGDNIDVVRAPRYAHAVTMALGDDRSIFCLLVFQQVGYDRSESPNKSAVSACERY